MIAYNRTTLDNLAVREQADEALADGCITPEENALIGATYPVDFYTPNIFICVGLFLLTVVIAACSLGIFLLASSVNSSGTFGIQLIFFGLLCYGALEFVVHKKKHYRSGVDFGFMCMSAILSCSGIYAMANNMSAPWLCFTLLITGLFFTLRFADLFMTLVTYVALIALIVNFAIEMGRTAQMVAPFVIMAVSVAVWFLFKRLYTYSACRHYRQSLTLLKAVSLISSYLAGNYFVVREMNSFMLGHSGGDISMGWFFWMLTIATPLFYIYRGTRKKDRMLIWTGLILIAATVSTIRYYYQVLPAEWAMILGGIVVIGIAYGLIRYLKTPRHGFTSQETKDKYLLATLQLESMVIAETFSGQPGANAPNNDFQFGGGSGGGGGAGGQF